MLSNYAFKINLRRHMCKRPWLQNNTLMQLNVGYNEIYNDGAWELSEAVGDNTGLQAGAYLVHFLAQRRRFLWDRGCMWGCSGGVYGVLSGSKECVGCILCQRRLSLS